MNARMVAWSVICPGIWLRQISNALTVLCRLTLEVPAMPLNLKAPMPHTSIGSCLVGKGLPRAELGVHTGHLASAYSLQLVTAGW